MEHWRLPRLNPQQVKGALQHGPVMTTINAIKEFYAYRDGVFDNPNCTEKNNHAVIVVGYGVDQTTGKEFVLIKNSWGTKWGEKGYGRIAAHLKDRPSGVCGWANYVW